MEEQNKKLFSTLLMAVGTLFIVIAGAIFISKTWGYLPEGVKKFILLLITSAFFSVSYMADQKWNLKKTAIAFYYLGVCFTGYTIFSISSMFIDEFLLKLVISQIGMCIPVVIRFLNKNSVLDFILEMVLTDGMAMCLAFNYGTDEKNYILVSMAYVTTVIAALIYYVKKCIPDSIEMKAISIAAYGIHLVVALYISLYYLVSDLSPVQLIVSLTLVFVSFNVVYYSYKEKTLRIIQSIFTCYYSFATLTSVAHLIYDNVPETVTRGIFFATFVVGICMMIVSYRKELLYINIGVAFVASFIQADYDLGRLFIDDSAFFPYAFVMAIALLAVEYLHNERKISSKILNSVVAWFAMGSINLISFCSYDFAKSNALQLWGALFFIQVSTLTLQLYFEKSLLRTIALFITVVTLCVNPLFTVDIFEAEYIAIIVSIGIVLLGFIWYDNKKLVEIIQFILACITLGMLLIYNISEYSVEHVLFFCIVNVIILIASSFFKKKNYAIVSSACLVLTVIYVSRAIWMSIAWWVYLFVAGVILVLFAIKREKAEN